MANKEHSIKKVQGLFKEAKISELEPLILSFKKDERRGVQKIISSYEKLLAKQEKIKIRHEEMLAFDASYADFVIGMDEVGRGPLFGCTVACACHIKACDDLIEVYDSKSLSEKRREELFDKIIENAICYGVGIVPASTIDEVGVQRAISLAMKSALDDCYKENGSLLNKTLTSADSHNSLILSDYISFDIDGYNYTPITKGDRQSFQIACASIIAKVTRDRIMVELDAKYPEYDLKNNKGYGSKKHIEAIKKYGASERHRMSFLKGILDEGSK